MLMRMTLLLMLFLIGCAPQMRITPGAIPTADVPPKELKVESENYVKAHIQESDYKEISGGPEVSRTKKMVERLSRAAGYPANTFPVHVVDAGDMVNAAAFNGAAIVVYKELLVKVPDDADLATVLGHEMGHILAKHYKDQEEEASRAQTVGIGSTILGAIVSVGTSVAGFGSVSDMAGDATEGVTSAIGYGAYVGSFSRVQEYEADHIGLLLMAKAGYDPEQAPKFWAKSEEIFGSESSEVGAFFSTHPAESDRQKELLKAMPMALALYKPGKAGASKTSKKK